MDDWRTPSCATGPDRFDGRSGRALLLNLSALDTAVVASATGKDKEQVADPCDVEDNCVVPRDNDYEFGVPYDGLPGLLDWPRKSPDP